MTLQHLPQGEGVKSNDPSISSTRGRGTGSRPSTTGSSKYVIHVYLFSISYALNIPNDAFFLFQN
jgi:hypothetical protein